MTLLRHPSIGLDRRTVQAPAALLDRVRAMLPLLRNEGEVADAQGAIATPAWAVLQQSGLLQAPLAAEDGGSDLTAPACPERLCDILRLLGSADLSLARLYEGHVNAIALVARYGSAAQTRALAADVRACALSAVWGADDARGMTAEREGDSYRLHGRKILASGAGLVARPLVTAGTPEGPQLFLLTLAPGERADIAGWTAQGMRSTATGSVDLEGLLLARDAAVGAAGDFLRQPHFSGGAWRFCAAHLGAAEQLVDLFREHLVARKRDGDPYQRQRVAHAVAAVGTARFWIEAAARRLADDLADPADVVAFTNLTRMITERSALDVIEAVQRGVGLAAFVRPNPIERIARDLATYLRQPVPDLAMADAARAVLASPRATGELWQPA